MFVRPCVCLSVRLSVVCLLSVVVRHRKSDPQHNNRIFQTTVAGMMAKKYTLFLMEIFQTTVAGMNAKKRTLF